MANFMLREFYLSMIKAATTPLYSLSLIDERNFAISDLVLWIAKPPAPAPNLFSPRKSPMRIPGQKWRNQQHGSEGRHWSQAA